MMPTNGLTAFVTGASGFVGSYVIAGLVAQGYHVVGLGNEIAGVHTSLAGDLTDAHSIDLAIQKSFPDIVVHLAALTEVDQSNTDAFYQVNVVGTLNLLEALEKLENPPKKILIASCSDIDVSQHRINTELIFDKSPINHYAISKLTMDYMAQTWFGRLPIIITRTANIIGLGKRSFCPVSNIIDHYRRGDREIYLDNNIDIIRDYLDVRDVAACFIALLNSPARSQIISICSGQATSFRTIINIMNNISGYEIKVHTNYDLELSKKIKIPCDSFELLKNLINFTPNIPLLETLRLMFIGK